MKAITLWQPWASLIGRGKNNETRSWSTTYRGPLAIHAAKTFPTVARQFCYNQQVVQALFPAFRVKWVPELILRLPRGEIVAVAEWTDVWAVGHNTTDRIIALSSTELAFGDYEDGRKVWVFENIRFVDPPISARGRQGLWEWMPPEGWEMPE